MTEMKNKMDRIYNRSDIWIKTQVKTGPQQYKQCKINPREKDWEKKETVN